MLINYYFRKLPQESYQEKEPTQPTEEVKQSTWLIPDISDEVSNKQIEKFKDLFDVIDLDESGEICLEEMRIVLSEKGYSNHFIEVSLFLKIKICLIRREPTVLSTASLVLLC